MKATSIITTLRARVAMTLLLAITTFTSAWATEFITDVMLIGGTQSETETLLKKYKKEGWQPYDQDLNAGCGSSSDYIYLLYKAADNYTTANLTFITNFYISTSSGTAPDDVRYNNHDYHLVPFDGGDHFKSKKGDLNSNCGSSSDDIHLYYIKDIVNLNYQAVSSIVFNNTQSGAVGKNGGTTGYNLNAGTSGNKIYLHITQERAHWWKIQKTSDGGKCRLIDYDSDVDKSKVKAVPAIIEGATVVDIYPDIDFTMFENLETFYFSNSTEVSTMPSVAGCSNFLQVNTIDDNGNVKEYELPPSITSLPDKAFQNTKLIDIKMPNVSSVGEYVFSGCSSLPVTDNIRYADTYLVKAADTNLSQYTIKAGTRFVGEDAFNGCSAFQSIEIPNTVTYIGIAAFQGCSRLDSINIPNSVMSIGKGTFYNCSSLTSVSIGNSVTSIGEGAFYGCSGLKSVIIGNGVTSIGESAFKGGSSLTSVIIPNSVTSIGNSAFQYCKGLTSVTIPNSVTSIGEYAFLGCSSLDSVTINSDAIMSKTYSYFSSLKDIFDNYVKKYTIGDGVTAIGQYAFYQCTSVESVTIGKDVKSIGYATFYGCSSLTDIYFDGMETQWGQVSKGQYWKPDATKVHWRCTVTFNANGHGTAPAAQTGLWSSESKATEPVAPTASGVVFTGWYTNAACTTKWDFSTPVPGDMTLYAGWENLLLLADNTANDIAPYNGQKCSVTLSGRTLYKDGTWNTLCLPFAVTDGDATDDISFSGTPLEGAVVKILDSSSSAKSTLTLNFSSATSITAGTPCIVRWEKTDNNAGNNDHNLYEPTFNGVIINNELHPVDQAAVDFTGSFSPVSLAAGDRSVLYLDANNSLFYPITAMTIGSCRACFQLADGLFNFDLGDVNGDGIITVTDVMMLVNSILGHVNNKFITANADVNNDNNITVTDVMVLVNNILNGKSTFKVVTNIDDFPIKFGGGGKNPARVGMNQIWR